MSLEKVQKYFKQYGMDDRIIVLDESSATVDLAAHALHTKPAQIAKTLSFMVGNQPILIEDSARRPPYFRQGMNCASFYDICCTFQISHTFVCALL